MPETYTAFVGHRKLAAGDAVAVAAAVHAAQSDGASHVLVFDDETGEQVELDQRATPPMIAGRSTPRATRGRPKLGVVAREVTLLPRHWEWLGRQPGGASAALRRLVEAASRQADDGGQSRDATYKVMSALAGDLPGFEEATRALFTDDRQRLLALMREWPQDVSRYISGRLT
jgi:hypothetical protein